MLWELADYFKKKITMTVIPAMRNLLSSKKSLVGMFIVMLILQMLLSVICISGIENILDQQNVLDHYNALIASSDIGNSESDAFHSESFKVAFSSTSIFIGALLIWGVCAVTVYQKVTFASADRDKYIWGMYVTHGAKIKKIRGMLKSALYVPHFIATAVAYPLSIKLCNYALRNHGYSYSFSWLTLVTVIVLSYVCIRLVVEYECFIIRKMSCVELLKEEDSPKSVCFPRKHSRLVRGFTSTRYASNTFIRMRKYYLSLAAIAAVPAVIWICFHVSVKSEDSYLSRQVSEFNVVVRQGLSEDELNSIEALDFKGLDGVHSLSTGAHYISSKLHTHLLLDKSHYTTIDETPYLTDLYADNSLTLCVNDRAFRQRTGYNTGNVREGFVTVISPVDSPKYNYVEGDKIWLAVSHLTGNVRVVDKSNVELLREEIGGEYEYIELEVAAHDHVTDTISKTGFNSVDDTYFVLNRVDYERITSISADSYSYEVDVSGAIFGTTLDNFASFDVTLPKSALTTVPAPKDSLTMSGSYTATVTLTEIVTTGDKQPQTWTLPVDSKFQYVYINSVTDNGDTVTLNVSPCDVVTVHAGLFWDVLLGFGTPSMPSNDRMYVPATCQNNLTITDTSVSVSAEKIIVNLNSAVSAAEAGTHAYVTSQNLVSTNNSLLLESLYADNSFILACADDRTTASLGMEIPYVKSGNAVLVLPSSSYSHHLALSEGDKLRVAVTLADVLGYDPNSIAQGGIYDTLAEQLKLNDYEYVQCYISKIIYSDSITDPYVFLNADDFSTVIGKSAPYVSFDILIDAGLESDSYAELRREISEWATAKKFRPTVTSTGGYIEHLLRKNANYSTIISLISILVPLIIPFIWYYPLATLLDRRRTELKVLEAMGKRRRQIHASLLAEGALVSACGFITVIVFCYPAMYIFKLICKWCALPLEFDMASLTLPTLLFAAVFSALCAAVSFAICYTMTLPKRIRMKKQGGHYGNS